MSPELKAFYEYHSSLMEPWDGPASIAFTDGTLIGAVLDRNGLRPSRYYVTKDDLVVMASEVGVLDIPDEDILVKERLHPGRIFLVDTAKGRIVVDDEIKTRAGVGAAVRRAGWPSISSTSKICRRRRTCPRRATRRSRSGSRCSATRRKICDCSWRRWRRTAKKPIGSMGTDTALAVLSDRSRLLYDYFSQVFAQVTNPPLDAIREELVTTMGSTVGPEGNLLDPRPESCRQIKIEYPVIDNVQLAKLRHVYEPGFKAITLPMLFDPRQGGAGPRARDGPAEAAGQRRRRSRLHDRHPVGPRRRSRARADSEPAGDGRRAPPPRAAGHAHALRPRRRNRRRARSASLRAAARLRRRRRQPVPGVRDARRHDPAASCSSASRTRRRSSTTSTRSTRAS